MPKGTSEALRAAIDKALKFDALLERAPLAILYDAATNKGEVIDLSKATGMLRRPDGSVAWEREDGD